MACSGPPSSRAGKQSRVALDDTLMEVMDDDLFRRDDVAMFISLVKEHLKRGAATKRGISPKEYVSRARERWGACNTDGVYMIKMLVDPLVQPEIMAELPPEWQAKVEPFCELIAAIDSNGDLVNAPPGYVAPSYPDVMLGVIPAGSAAPGTIPDPAQPGDYIIAFLDVLGFEALLNELGLDEVARRYDALLKTALSPQSEDKPWSQEIAIVLGEPVSGLMFLPIQTAYFSDSLLLWVNYHPRHVPFFLDRCARVFCQALALGIPVRGAISIGKAILDRSRGIYLGTPVIEAVRLEGKSNWIGIALAASWKSETKRVPVPPDRVFPYEPPLKDGGQALFSDLVLDWPRVWRESRTDSPVECLNSLCRPELPPTLKDRYTAAVRFVEYSAANQDWFLPPGAKRLTVRDLSHS